MRSAVLFFTVFISVIFAAIAYEYVDLTSGCQHQYVRGGGYCYQKVDNPRKSWEDAKRFCANSGGYLLTIKSKAVKQMTVDFVMGITGPSTAPTKFERRWTSLNDKQEEGNFVWTDGSKLNTTFVDWIKSLNKPEFGSIESGLWNSDGYLISENGNINALTGCQYSSPDTEQCVNSNWTYYGGNCYLTTFDVRKADSGTKSGEIVCKSYFHNQSDYNTQLLKIDNKGVLNFLKSHIKPDTTLLTSLERHRYPDRWEWADGTKVDWSLFSKASEPNNGDGKEEQDCVSMTSYGSLYDDPCNKELPFICQKALDSTNPSSSKVQASSTKASNATSEKLCAYKDKKKCGDGAETYRGWNAAMIFITCICLLWISE